LYLTLYGLTSEYSAAQYVASSLSPSPRRLLLRVCRHELDELNPLAPSYGSYFTSDRCLPRVFRCRAGPGTRPREFTSNGCRRVTTPDLICRSCSCRDAAQGNKTYAYASMCFARKRAAELSSWQHELMTVLLSQTNPAIKFCLLAGVLGHVCLIDDGPKKLLLLEQGRVKSGDCILTGKFQSSGRVCALTTRDLRPEHSLSGGSGHSRPRSSDRCTEIDGKIESPQHPQARPWMDSTCKVFLVDENGPPTGDATPQPSQER
jgi:hypothetical protein